MSNKYSPVQKLDHFCKMMVACDNFIIKSMINLMLMSTHVRNRQNQA